MPRYNPAVLEPKWQKYWEENKTFAVESLPKGETMYVLDMFPYPSGNGLHVGHPEGYTATDIVCRFNRMRGKAVMHPMGWDAFGLPAEQHAKKTGTHPRITTEKNIDTFRRQLKMLGFSYDWDRELATTDVDYFRWTQFIFLVLFDTWYDAEAEKGRPIDELPIPEDVAAQGEAAVEEYKDDHRLAFQCETPVNWCPNLGTVLANEEVINGRSERGDHPVVRMPLRQWMLRITAYADRLEKDLDDLDWTESIKLLQRNWIGRSTGAEVDFYVGDQEGFDAWKTARDGSGFPRKPGDDVLRIYTTRPDTLFGATYMVIAPEHPFVERLTTAEQKEAVQAYCDQAARKSDLDRTDLAKDKTGVFTGSYAINPVNGSPVPIWIADYVLISYGTGAIMAVPAHDTRDFEFAKQFELPITPVVDPGKAKDDNGRAWSELVDATEAAFTEHGVAMNSGPYDGLATAAFKQKISDDLDEQGLGRAAVNYKLRDWLFSRQHFWGEPFPILHELDADGNMTGRVRAIPAEELPVDLPAEMRFDVAHNSPEPPLDAAPEEWLYVTIDGKRYKRETNSMPQWAGSCWYYLRYLDPTNNEQLIDPAIEKKWMPVDLYVGGAEHAVLHLLYARFWHKVLYDRGYVTTKEPFHKLVNQGMILGEPEATVYAMKHIEAIAPADVDADAEGGPIRKSTGKPIVRVMLPTEDDDLQEAYVEPDDLLSSTDVTKDEEGNSTLKSTGVEVLALRTFEDQLTKKDRNFVLQADPETKVESRAYKMSKSRGNVINPDDIVKDYGADSLRLYEMFMGPLEATKPWSMDGVSGVYNFLGRVWRMLVDEDAEEIVLHPAVQDVEPDEESNRVLHKTIKAVTSDIDAMAFNTAIARMMEFTNFFLKQDVRPKSAMERLVLLLSPFAPHVAEELWSLLGHDKTLAYEPWPAYDEGAIVESSIEIPVQIKGKVRAKIQVPADADKDQLEELAKADPRVAEQLEGKQIVKTIVVPGRMVNFVTKG